MSNVDLVFAYRRRYRSPTLWPSLLALSSMSLAASSTFLPPPPPPGLPPGFPPSPLPFDGWVTLVKQAYAVMEKERKSG